MIQSPTILLFTIIFLVHSILLIIKWIEVRYRPLMAHLGLINRKEMEIHEIALDYHQMGIIVPFCLLTPPGSLPRQHVRRIENRLIVEGMLIWFGSITSSTVFTYYLAPV